jgi:hypothetical protein
MSIDVTPEPIVTEVNPGQPLNAALPIVLTESGITSSPVNPVQL